MWIKDILRRAVRYFYWLYRLGQARKGKGIKLHFPVKVEGAGTLEIGDGCLIDRNVYLGIGAGGRIVLGKNCRIDSGVEIRVGRGGEIIFGDGCWIMSGTVIRATKNRFVFGENVVISTNVQIFSRESGYEGSFTVGSGTHINDYAMLDVTGELQIGQKVAFGQYSVAFTHDHIYTDSSKPAWQGGVKTGRVVIEDWAWIGAKVVILPDVTVGRRTVVASGAVVTKDCPQETVCGGVPAQVLKEIE